MGKAFDFEPESVRKSITVGDLELAITLQGFSLEKAATMSAVLDMKLKKIDPAIMSSLGGTGEYHIHITLPNGAEIQLADVSEAIKDAATRMIAAEFVDTSKLGEGEVSFESGVDMQCDAG